MKARDYNVPNLYGFYQSSQNTLLILVFGNLKLKTGF